MADEKNLTDQENLASVANGENLADEESVAGGEDLASVRRPVLHIDYIQCIDEQDGLKYLGSDEIYFKFNEYHQGGEPVISSSSPIYTSVDEGEKYNINFSRPFIYKNDYVITQLWESDQDEFGRGGDDLIGAFTVDKSYVGTGQHTATLAGSGGQYDVTYKVTW